MSASWRTQIHRLAAAVLAAGLAACGAPGRTVTIGDVAPGLAKLVIDLPELRGQMRKDSNGGRVNVDYVVDYSARADRDTGLPRIEVVMKEVGAIHLILVDRTLRGIREDFQFLNSRQVNGGPDESFDSAFGPTDVEFITVDGLPCFSFITRINWGQGGKGERLLYGYYCDRAGGKLDLARAKAIHGRIGIRDIAMPVDYVEDGGTTAGVARRPVSGYWDGVMGNLQGSMELAAEGDGKGQFRVILARGNAACRGTWDGPADPDAKGGYRGRWQLVCDNGRKAEGMFETRADGHGRGSGRDDLGNNVSVTY